MQPLGARNSSAITIFPMTNWLHRPVKSSKTRERRRREKYRQFRFVASRGTRGRDNQRVGVTDAAHVTDTAKELGPVAKVAETQK